jgi:hypothetical protein
MPKVLSKFNKSQKNGSKRSINKVCNKFSLNKTQLNNSSLIEFDFEKDYSNENSFSTELNWQMFYNIQHKDMLDNIKYDIQKIKSKNNITDKDIIQVYSEKSNTKSNDLSLEEQDIQTIRNHFINLEMLARQKFLKK